VMHIPRATYRIQFTPSFGFRQALEIIPYLAALGISDVYASPIFRARKGSEHGYDQVDPGELNPELGTPLQFKKLTETVKKHGMGWVQDIVPNHMAFDAQNPYLADVLENGPGSAYYRYFDIDWEHYYEAIRGKVLAPFLGSYYSQALENGEIHLGFDRHGFAISYYSLSFPLKIESYLSILTESLAAVRRDLGEKHSDYIQLLGILYVLKTLRDNADNGERHDQIQFIKQNLWALYEKSPSIHAAIDSVIKEFNGHCNEPESFNLLESLLAEQWFSLAYWKVASEEINYRRFFSINDLISLSMERKEVFTTMHQLLLRLVREGIFTGLRVDHIDGLYDPGVYLQRLRDAAPDAFLIVEKILTSGEPMPSWPIQGTTGYDFLNALNGVFCDRTSAKAFTSSYQRFTGMRQSYEEQVYLNKKFIIERFFLGDVNNLAHLLKKITSRHRYGSDITFGSLKQALAEILAQFPVYRTYLDSEAVSEIDRRTIETVIERAGERNPGNLKEINYVGQILLGEIEKFLPGDERLQWLHFAMRFQQLTGPLMAKGFEDTLMYVYNRLLSLNEVGGHPDRFGLSLEDFHEFNLERCKGWPHTLNATATHDTKRGEDVRARLNVLSEMPREWAQQIRSWSQTNRGLKRTVKRCKVPDKNDEYFFYQTMVGAWPFAEEDYPDFVIRIKDYLIKAVREAKVHSSWRKPELDYEDAFLHFVDQVLPLHPDNPFLKEFIPWQSKVAHYGMLNGLAQTLIKITAPGIPDFYQGTEFWDLSLVDPDNRRPVDYVRRKDVLKEILSRQSSGLPELLRDLLANMTDGRVKMFLIHRALSARKRFASLFMQGSYQPLNISGPHAEQVIAFARNLGNECIVTVAPRHLTRWLDEGTLPMGLETWGGTVLRLPDSSGQVWTDLLTETTFTAADGELDIGGILTLFPVGLLLGKAASGPR